LNSAKISGKPQTITEFHPDGEARAGATDVAGRVGAGTGDGGADGGGLAGNDAVASLSFFKSICSCARVAIVLFWAVAADCCED
jgi:hypothetical protein